MLLTTTNNIEGKEIKEYLGLVYGTDIYLIGGLFGGGLANQENLFGLALQEATKKLVAKATALGADAVVGMQSNFTAPGSTNHMILTVIGTAVKTSASESNYIDELPEL